MAKGDLTKQLRETETIIHQQMTNFQTLYMTISELNAFISNHPESADIGCIKALEKVLLSNDHLKQSKSFFLYRETANTIVSIIKSASDNSLMNEALTVLKKTICSSSKDRLRAVAEAAGTLSLKIKPEAPPSFDTSAISSICFNELLKKQGITKCGNTRWIGRSLVSDIDTEKILVLKMAKADDNLSELNMENGYMDYLAENFSTHLKFNIPSPLKISDHFLFSIKELPVPVPAKEQFRLHKDTICIGFITEKAYFIYPNEKSQDLKIDEEKFQEIILRSSALFGRLSGKGIIHTAPVPLFHNRVQQDRREDDGIYDWAKGGRLDQWLESCRFPNFGESGIRDFEHFELYDGNSLKLYKHIGSHILSLILVTGSFFRIIGKDGSNKNLTGKSGFDGNGDGIDAKKLFNKILFEQLLESILKTYYKSFTGKKTINGSSFDFKSLTTMLIDEMGEDKHMVEILRIADQKKMSADEFHSFLLEKGFSPEQISRLIKGEKEIEIPTGPHLGGFNQKISIPLLTDLLAKISAFCIIDKFAQENTTPNT